MSINRFGNNADKVSKFAEKAKREKRRILSTTWRSKPTISTKGASTSRRASKSWSIV